MTPRISARPAGDHDLADRPAALDERVCLDQIGGVDRGKRLGERGADAALVDEVGQVIQDAVLLGHPLGLKHRAREHQLEAERRSS